MNKAAVPFEFDINEPKYVKIEPPSRRGLTAGAERSAHLNATEADIKRGWGRKWGYWLLGGTIAALVGGLSFYDGGFNDPIQMASTAPDDRVTALPESRLVEKARVTPPYEENGNGRVLLTDGEQPLTVSVADQIDDTPINNESSKKAVKQAHSASYEHKQQRMPAAQYAIPAMRTTPAATQVNTYTPSGAIAAVVETPQYESVITASAPASAAMAERDENVAPDNKASSAMTIQTSSDVSRVSNELTQVDAVPNAGPSNIETPPAHTEKLMEAKPATSTQMAPSSNSEPATTFGVLQKKPANDVHSNQHSAAHIEQDKITELARQPLQTVKPAIPISKKNSDNLNVQIPVPDQFLGSSYTNEYIKVANEYQLNGQEDDAIDFLVLAIKDSLQREDISSQALAPLVQVLSEMLLSKQKSQEFLWILEYIDPFIQKTPALWALQGQAAQDLGLTEQSANAYLMAATLDPSKQRWLLSAALSLATLSLTQAATSMLQSAEKLGPIPPDVTDFLTAHHVVTSILPSSSLLASEMMQQNESRDNQETMGNFNTVPK